LRAAVRFAIQVLRKVKRREPVDLDRVITRLELVRLTDKARAKERRAMGQRSLAQRVGG
jgi:hypothetical protein